MYKDLKGEVNLIKKENSGADRRGNTVCMAVRNVRSDFEEFVDENVDVGEDNYDFASAGQGIRSDRARLGGLGIFMAWRIMNIWMGTWTPLNRKFLTFKEKTISRLIWSGKQK
jgi:hypothetical protein